MIANLRSIVDEIHTEEQRRMAETNRFVEEQKIRKALAPDLWEKLKDELRANCDAIGKESPVVLKAQDQGIDALTIKNPRKGRTVSLTYNPEVPCIAIKGTYANGVLAFGVNPDGASICFVENGEPMLMDDIAFNVIRSLTKS